MRLYEKTHELRRTLRKAWEIFRANQVGVSQAIDGADIDVDRLEEAYQKSPLRSQPNDFCLIRILGNDLPPRHEVGQTAKNLKFILENESDFPQCKKVWLVNRIVSSKEVSFIESLLREHRQEFEVIPFDPDQYAKIERDYSIFPAPDFLTSQGFERLVRKQQKDAIKATYWKKNRYAMNNNGARNRALEIGRSKAKWILPWDGNCFLSDAAWAEISTRIRSKPYYRHFVTPMERIKRNEQILKPGYKPRPSEEPQVIFRADYVTKFNEDFVYGRRPKIELLWTLGIPGYWDVWDDTPWDPKRRDLAEDAHAFAVAGWVNRLSSGSALQENKSLFGTAYRVFRRQNAIIGNLDRFDRPASSL